ncbi:STAS domain-containing protein [Thalassococcus sp. BH17M4-6]|uniref:STAS domain-containing protein n=1 Tax=Thalassococcus sp. BH17M4-6 TaxID=3413148 RepID=UPI003BC98110
MNLSHHQTDGQLVVTVKQPRIDAVVAIQFKDRMRELSALGPDRIVLDLGEVAFIDSSGLGAIVAAMKQLDDSQRLDLAALTPTVAKVFRLTRMDTIFTIYPDVPAAFARQAG